MKTITMNMPVTFNYWDMVKNLSDNAKRELILLLQQSLKEKSDDEILEKICDNEGTHYTTTADEYVEEMMSGRKTRREVIEL